MQRVNCLYPVAYCLDYYATAFPVYKTHLLDSITDSEAIRMESTLFHTT